MATTETVPSTAQVPNPTDSNNANINSIRTTYNPNSQNSSIQARRDDTGLLKAIWNYMLGGSSGNSNNQQKNAPSKKGDLISPLVIPFS